MPTRGNARKIGVRVEARPVASARQNGELALSASRIGTWTRMPLATWIALSGSSSADVHVQAEDELLARDEAQRADQVAIARAATIRWSSHIANGWVPAEPMVRPLRAAALA